MGITTQIKKCVVDSARLLWWLQIFARNGTLTPSIRHIKPNKDRVFIFGNGPSLKEDITPYVRALQNEHTIMVNQSLTHSLALQLKPTYYVLMDPAYWGHYTDEENHENSLTKCCMDLSKALSKVYWNMILLAPHNFFKRRNNKGIAIDNKNITIKTFNATELYSFARLERFLYKTNLAIPSGINVLIASLCCAIAMGYKKIYLLGADSNWHQQLYVDESNRLYLHDAHYYDEGSLPPKVYVPYTFSFVSKCMANAFRAYEELGKLQFNITNLSSTSMIDAFPRDSLKNVLGGGAYQHNEIVFLVCIFLCYHILIYSRFSIYTNPRIQNTTHYQAFIVFSALLIHLNNTTKAAL